MIDDAPFIKTIKERLEAHEQGKKLLDKFSMLQLVNGVKYERVLHLKSQLSLNLDFISSLDYSVYHGSHDLFEPISCFQVFPCKILSSIAASSSTHSSLLFRIEVMTASCLAGYLMTSSYTTE